MKFAGSVGVYKIYRSGPRSFNVQHAGNQVATATSRRQAYRAAHMLNRDRRINPPQKEHRA